MPLANFSPEPLPARPAPREIGPVTETLEQVRAERAALALVLNAVPRKEHNAAVMSSGVDILVYSHAMCRGLGRRGDA